MIELPEAVAIARQIDDALRGRQITEAVRGNSPHKFAFYSGPPERYAELMVGRTIGQARADGGLIVIDLLSAGTTEHQLVLGGGGERILYHTSADTLPKKHQLLVRFGDGTFLSVKVQGWGAVQLFDAASPEKRWCGFDKGLMPTDEGFGFTYFNALIDDLDADDPRSVKYFIISEPGVRGIGNGYLQDILFRARIHPRTRVVSFTPEQRRDLHAAIVGTIDQAVALGGRDDEYDIFGDTGGYSRILSSKATGRPCPTCGDTVVKESYLGGAVYTCPTCQPRPPTPPRRKRKRKR